MKLQFSTSVNPKRKIVSLVNDLKINMKGMRNNIFKDIELFRSII